MNKHYEALYGDAVKLVRRLGRASNCDLREHLDLPYHIAADLIARMQRGGLIGTSLDDDSDRPGFALIEPRGFY